MPYHVIEFEELPYADIDKYICVPESWIKWRNEVKRQVIVAYPVEKPSCIQQRVENDSKYSRNWKCFMAKVEYNTNGYNEAVNFIKYLNSKRNREAEDSNKQEQDKEKPSCSNDNIPDDSKKQDNETSDGNDNVPDDSKKQDNETSDDDATYVLSELDTDESETTNDYSSDESEKTVIFPSNHKSRKASERNRGNPKIILPPEYDPNFPRWSLKYPETNYKGRVDLVELRPGRIRSGIYVDLRACNKCFEVSADDNSLARNLLIVIFTKSALRVCTLTGKVPAGFTGDESEIRPGLYVHGVNALVQTVLWHGFGDSDESMIRKCLSAKLYHLRFKL